MKKQYLIFCFTLAVAMSLVSNAAAQTQTLTLNLKDTTCVNWQTDIYPPNYSTCEQGGFWTHTYDSIANPPLCFGSFNLTHNAGFDIYSYWGGFTLSVSGDSLCYSGKCPDSCDCKTTNPNCTLVGSNEWVYNQWGIMAGGGLSNSAAKGKPHAVVKGDPYLVAYWDYYSETKRDRSLEITLNGNSLFNLLEFYVCNHPWPFYGNYYGDGFARPLNQPGDHFDLIVHGVKADGTEVLDSVMLAEYDASEPLGVYQSPNWKFVSASATFTNLQSVYFTMYSTDSSAQYGPNTAVYFCLDKVKVKKTGKVAPASGRIQKRQVSAPKLIEVVDYFPLSSYTGGELTVYEPNGKVVLKTTLKEGEKPNLSKLPDGEYRLFHGSRVYPVLKKGSR